MAAPKDTSSTNGGAERRRGERVPANRPVHFSDYRAMGPLRDGTVTDMSTGGFRIVTHTPEQAGTSIQIEMRPDASNSDDGVILYEGRVAHVTPLDDGNFAMGIVKTQRPLTSGIAGSPATVSGALGSGVKEVGTAGGAASSRSRQNASSNDDSANGKKATFRRIGKEQNCPRERKSSKRFGALLALGFVGLLLLLLSRMDTTDRDQVARLSGGGTAGQDDATSIEPFFTIPDVGPAEMSAQEDDEPFEKVEAAPIDMDSILGHGALAAFKALDEKDGNVAESALDDWETSPQSSPVQQLTALLQYAEEAMRRGEDELARTAIRKGLKAPEDLPASWQAYAATSRYALMQQDVPPLLDKPVWLEKATTGNALQPPVSLEVDKTNYTLHVRRGNQVIRSFPVGLGQFDGTPAGQYQIVNKLASPDWYNRGEIVPAGSPDNPLGDSWMGLGKDGTATSYGIHPTASPRSVGQPMSRGCVRMLPRDAEWLFRVAPIGTPVTIR